ncbi:MAG: O-acetylhomoserine aminocarboxypropyltransferase/cysteine synthase [Atopobiaceae bacterium]|jgi:O-acetylhomoserine (thiol)-lyase|nr:O-acetylhomoserine aminocarboxypropyltransferase/cysteine synthase [Atopobiaceae bacterium]MCH4214223.1 O-acetylhomoserine aminocarboxypropyltransferase/cysteine synthase [Atopobiaceae bacterium]MCH4230483.1 O-acetylhomoserine aminocarboxypropyltransferase/cysteine synthase [Atopobiaceae bacterium]MCH4275889.1 O-acetylhomoserine aminocarboxypropyltransferase/cysteine synthase [Atopobiaceae bacterium]MCI1226650.1 O-acetylhomoserine aminocarboxypropyltransferase/cysteine synthase [Atopobiaceae
MAQATARPYHFETLQLHVGQESPDPATDSRAVPIYQTTSYVFHDCQHAADRFGLKDAGNIYGRLTNSTEDVFERRIAALEGGVAGLAVASGAAAITYTIQGLAGEGDHIVAQKTIYGGTYNLLAHTLPRLGIQTTFVDAHDLAQLEGAIRPETKAVYLETLGNPNSDIPDIDAIATIAHAHGLPLVVDNTFGTPYLIRPIEHGADIVVHSATKFIGGHGTTLGGIVVDGGTFDWSSSDRFPQLTEGNPSYHGISFVEAAGPAAFATYLRAIILRDEGATISPFNAFLLLQGTETLSLRIERHVENALKVVDYLQGQPKVAHVNHPSLPDHPDHELYERYFPDGAGSIFTFEIEGGQEAAFRFIDHLELFSLLANVADVKSLVIHPATTTHAELSPSELAEQGITPGTIRLSIGTEHIDDIIADLDRAFAAV